VFIKHFICGTGNGVSSKLRRKNSHVYSSSLSSQSSESCSGQKRLLKTISILLQDLKLISNQQQLISKTDTNAQTT